MLLLKSSNKKAKLTPIIKSENINDTTKQSLAKTRAKNLILTLFCLVFLF